MANILSVPLPVLLQAQDLANSEQVEYHVYKTEKSWEIVVDPVDDPTARLMATIRPRKRSKWDGVTNGR